MNILKEYDALLAQQKMIARAPDYDNDPIIQKIIKLMTYDVPSTISFLDDECTEKKFVWLNEVFYEIAQKTRSKDFINALWNVSRKYPIVTAKYNIIY